MTSRSGQTLTNSQRAHAVFLSVVHPASSSRCGPPRAILPSVIPPRSSVPTASGLAYLPPVRTLGDKPGHENAHEAPENAHHDQRHSEAVVRHACTPADNQPAASLSPHPEVSTAAHVTCAERPAPCAQRDSHVRLRPLDRSPAFTCPVSGCSFLELVRGVVPVTRASARFSGKNLDPFRRCVIYNFIYILRAEVKSLTIVGYCARVPCGRLTVSCILLQSMNYSELSSLLQVKNLTTVT